MAKKMTTDDLRQRVAEGERAKADLLRELTRKLEEHEKAAEALRAEILALSPSAASTRLYGMRARQVLAVVESSQEPVGPRHMVALGMNPSHASRILSNLVKTGKIKRIGFGLFVSKGGSDVDR